MNNLKFIKANFNDLGEIMKIIEKAKEFMWKNDNFQWDENYPILSDFYTDIVNDQLFVLKDDKNIYGVVALVKNQNIFQSLMSKKPIYFININRIAVNMDLNIKGLGQKMFDKILEHILQLDNIHYISGSTNSKNIGMQKIFEKNGFLKIFSFVFENSTEKAPYIRYEKLLKK